MKEKLTQLLQEGKDRIDAVRSEAELQEVKALLLGKQGSLTGLLKELPRLDAALRPEMGKAVNQAKAQLTALLDQRREAEGLRGIAGLRYLRPRHPAPVRRSAPHHPDVLRPQRRLPLYGLRDFRGVRHHQ